MLVVAEQPVRYAQAMSGRLAVQTLSVWLVLSHRWQQQTIQHAYAATVHSLTALALGHAAARLVRLAMVSAMAAALSVLRARGRQPTTAATAQHVLKARRLSPRAQQLPPSAQVSGA